eukprot:PhM_4_TR11464/c0_g1_i1/m.67401/K02736/PSMB4; 20S proteasome subunit beta 7
MATGGSVIAIKYEGGVVMASDTLLSYGSMSKVPNVPRSVIIGKYTAVCASGDYADFQDVVAGLEDVCRGEALDGTPEDSDSISPFEVFTYLQRVLYNKRSNFEPALCTFVVIGSKPGEQPFLGTIDSIGTHWTCEYAGTVFGKHFAVPILRQEVETRGMPKTRDEAIVLLEGCMRVLFYRECRTMNRIQMADASADGVVLSDPYTLDTQFEYEGFHFDKTAIIKS